MTEEATPRLVQVVRRPDEIRAPGENLGPLSRIIVARTDRLGDVVLTLPVVDAVRRSYPDARLAMLVRTALRPLAEMVRGVDEVLDASAEVRATRRALESFAPELLICVSRDSVLPQAAFMAGIRHRVGTGYRLFSALLSRRVNERRSPGRRHELEYALSFAHRAGAYSETPGFPLQSTGPARSAARAWLAERGVDRPFVLIHPGSGGSCPAWPPDRYATLAGRLLDAGRSVVFSIGPADAAIVPALEAATPAVAAAPRASLGIPELVALIREAAVTVSNSTGPLHLAAALGVPTLGFYAPWATCSVGRWGPYAENGWALVAEHREARAWSRVRRWRDGAALLGTIPPGLAAGIVGSLIDGELPTDAGRQSG